MDLTSALARGTRRFRLKRTRRPAACPLDVQLDGIHTAMPDLAPRSNR